jgi:hypothetical protein
MLILFDRDKITIPKFQRKYVWSLPQASKLIESFLIGLPVPNIFLFQKKYGKRFIVIDGNQRLQTIKKFFKNDFDANRKFKLQNVREKWNKKTFEQLNDDDKFKLETSVLRAINVKQLDPNDYSSIYHIFERLNTRGVNLNPMEVRMCVDESKFSDMLRELNENNVWRSLLHKPKVDNRLRDVEWILRFFSLKEKGDYYKKPMKKFLNSFLSEKKNLDDKKIEDYKSTFITTLDKVENLAVSESTKDTQSLQSSYNELIKNENYIKNISSNTSDVHIVKERITLAKQYLA